MRNLLTAFVIGGLLTSTATAKPREVRTLAPSSQWLLEYADESCRMARHFGEGRDKVTVVLDRFVPDESFRVTLAGSTIKPVAPGGPITGRMRFGPGNGDTEINGLPGYAGNQPVIVLLSEYRIAPISEAERKASDEARKTDTYFEAAPVGEAREKAATWLSFTGITKFDLVLETGPMDAPMRALRDCVWDLVGSWGLDVEQQKRLTRKAYTRNRAEGWFSAEDYPDRMIRSAQEGIVNIRTIVDANGAPESCHIQISTRPKEFDDVVCKIVMQKAKFHPALDANGKPVRSFAQITVVFRLR